MAQVSIDIRQLSFYSIGMTLDYLTRAEKLSRTNVAEIEDFARPHSGRMVGSLALLDITRNIPTFELYTECDFVNREILDTAYRQVGLNPSEPDSIKETESDQEKRRLTKFVTAQAVTITEMYVEMDYPGRGHAERFKSFKVTLRPPVIPDETIST